MLRPSVIIASLLIPSPIRTTPAAIQPAAIVQVLCIAPKYVSSGTAFRVGPEGLLLSVNHVTSEPNCFIAGKPITLSYKSPNSDFSELLGEEGPYLQVDCGGFIRDRKYLAIGFARGESPVTTLELTATGEHDPDGQAILTSMVPVIPGMSGGPILDEETGRVVGVVNAENFEDGLSWSQELKNEPICRGKVA